MEWLNPIKDAFLVLFLLEFIINWSYYKKVPAFDVSEKSDICFKSDWHKKFHFGVNVAFAIVGVMVLIKWILF